MAFDGVALTLAKEFIHRGEWLIQNNAVCCAVLAARNPGSLVATAPHDLLQSVLPHSRCQADAEAAGQVPQKTQ